MTGKMRSLLVCLLVAAVTFFGPGCPRSGNPTGSLKQGRVTVLIGSASKALSQALLEAAAPKSVVAANEIYSLTLTVTEISLDLDGEDDEDGEFEDDGDDHHGGHDDGEVEDGEDENDDDGDVEDNEDKHNDDGEDVSGEDEGDDDHGDDDQGEDEDDDSVVIFSGSQDIDLVSLDNVSQVFSATDIPAGVYHRITLKISDPRLRLASDPGTEITDIHLTCNDRLFVDADFEIPEGGNSLIKLTFNGVHLVREGNGSYVLTPQLDATVSVTSADVSATGTIASADLDADSLVVTLADGDVTVLYAGAAIFLPADTDTPTGTEADLVPGASVEVVGTIDADGVITASEIRVL